MIDLHTHTKYSDGTWDVAKLLEEAQKMNIEVLSITDHDTLKAYAIKNNLLMSGGSDCHGDRKTHRKIGIGNDNLNVDKSILDNWNIKDRLI